MIRTRLFTIYIIERPCLNEVIEQGKGIVYSHYASFLLRTEKKIASAPRINNKDDPANAILSPL